MSSRQKFSMNEQCTDVQEREDAHSEGWSENESALTSLVLIPVLRQACQKTFSQKTLCYVFR
ncbi:hypothetical protein KTT_54730 [Tengunoibacter tsumagoiensis]|uniref:Uncharacterized protein n=1 Tax=Tengunoibacter tsumagoiensis TaxID=2014871 RepID=A0A402A8V7_9CHLR|nr:hypothetical protein KTT_54730 [Tengunoibacter tsumagoiensis]